jgi:hypothetical protein
LWVVPDQAAALTAAQQTAFGTKGLYYNVHTAANPAGEIRGQIEREGSARLATLGAAQETPANSSTAYGAGIAIVDDSASGEVGGILLTSGLVSPTAAHIHGPGARGTAAGVIIGLKGP